MSWLDWGLIFAILCAVMYPLGIYIGKILQGESTFLSPILYPVERAFCRIMHIQPYVEMDWKQYTVALMIFNFLGVLTLYVLLRLQSILPLNPQSFGSVEPFLAFNTAISFVTNTNWQNYWRGKHFEQFQSNGGSCSSKFLIRCLWNCYFCRLIKRDLSP